MEEALKRDTEAVHARSRRSTAGCSRTGASRTRSDLRRALHLDHGPRPRDPRARVGARERRALRRDAAVVRLQRRRQPLAGRSRTTTRSGSSSTTRASWSSFTAATRATATTRRTGARAAAPRASRRRRSAASRCREGRRSTCSRR
jgi:hypothetical protein